MLIMVLCWAALPSLGGQCVDSDSDGAKMVEHCDKWGFSENAADFNCKESQMKCKCFLLPPKEVLTILVYQVNLQQSLFPTSSLHVNNEKQKHSKSTFSILSLGIAYKGLVLHIGLCTAMHQACFWINKCWFQAPRQKHVSVKTDHRSTVRDSIFRWSGWMHSQRSLMAPFLVLSVLSLLHYSSKTQHKLEELHLH